MSMDFNFHSTVITVPILRIAVKTGYLLIIIYLSHINNHKKRNYEKSEGKESRQSN
jgi:hypothetical protein